MAGFGLRIPRSTVCLQQKTIVFFSSLFSLGQRGTDSTAGKKDSTRIRDCQCLPVGDIEPPVEDVRLPVARTDALGSECADGILVLMFSGGDCIVCHWWLCHVASLTQWFKHWSA